MKKLIFLFLVGVTSIANGASIAWDGGGGLDSSWTNNLNWAGDVVPATIANNARINGLFVPTPTVSTAAPMFFNGKVNAAQTSPMPLLNIVEGGSLDVGEWLMLGGDDATARHGKLVMTGGTLNTGVYNAAAGHLFVAHGNAGGPSSVGYLDMSGGTINVGGNFAIGFSLNAGGYVNLSGGTINTNVFSMKQNGGTGTVSLTISGSGKLIINGDVSGTIQGYKDLGYINDDVIINLGMNPGKTTLYIPEPATICLLGLGVFGLLRRK